MNDLLIKALRKPRPPSAVRPSLTPPEEAQVKVERPAIRGPLIEFVKTRGWTTQVNIRVNGRVRVLRANRNEDGELVSLSIVRD